MHPKLITFEHDVNSPHQKGTKFNFVFHQQTTYILAQHKAYLEEIAYDTSKIAEHLFNTFVVPMAKHNDVKKFMPGHATFKKSNLLHQGMMRRAITDHYLVEIDGIDGQVRYTQFMALLMVNTTMGVPNPKKFVEEIEGKLHSLCKSNCKLKYAGSDFNSKGKPSNKQPEDIHATVYMACLCL
jgi:hypothetical protein